MARPWQLDCFDTARPREQAAADATAAALTEEDRLAAFDKGYKDGWEDATRAHAEDQAHISAEFGNNLQALSFTYHEARAAMLSEMETLLRGLVEAVLPGVARQTLGRMIRERLAEAAEALSDVPLEIVVAPCNRARVDALLENRVAPPVVVREEPSLGEGQAFLRFGDREEKLDLDAVLTEIRTAIEDFFAAAEATSDNPSEDQRRHG